LRQIKALGANYLRAVHYPPDPALPSLADRIGLLLSEEIPAWAEFGRPAVLQTSLGMLRELIERDYDHPSIFMWLVGNAGEAGSRTLEYHRQAIAFVKQRDPSRLASYVFDNDVYDKTGMEGDLAVVRAARMDVYCKNFYWPAPQIEEAAKHLPSDVPTVITEWSGGEGGDRENLAPGGSRGFGGPPGAALSEEAQAAGIPLQFEAWRAHLPGAASVSVPQLAGVCYWNWQDIEWPSLPFFFKGHGTLLGTGLVYADRTRKKAYKALQSLYATLP
jgi:hypothetical protein